MRPCHTRASSSLIIERQTVSNASCANQNSPVLNRSRAFSRYRRRSSGAICRLPSAISNPQEIQSTVTARNRANEDLDLALGAGLLDELITGTYRLRREHPDAKDLMLAHEQRGPLHRSAGRTESIRKLTDGVSHLPRPGCTDRWTECRLDTMRRTNPIRPGDVPRVVGAGAI